VAGNLIVSWSRWKQGASDAFFSTDDLREVARRFWGGLLAADFSTYEGKALAAKIVQNRAYAQESLVLCDVHWPMMITSANHPSGHVGDPTLESRVVSAITGKETDAGDLLLFGERVFNLQRAILLRQGWKGRQDDRLLDYYHQEPLKQGDVFFSPDGIMPGPDGKPISKLGTKIEQDDFEKLKSEYYRLRGWDPDTGYITRAKLAELDLKDAADDLEVRGLVK
jgi:aldehyde:ferredoxin oxidoreductase